MKNWKKLRLVGEKVFLRPIRKSDARRLFELIKEPEVRRFLRHPYAPFSFENERKRTEKAVQDWKTGKGFEFVVCDKQTGQVMGRGGLHHYKPERGECTIGTVLGKKNWHKGFGTETMQLLMRHAFEQFGMKRIGMYFNAKNPGSSGIARKGGFRKHKIFHEKDSETGEPMEIQSWYLSARSWRHSQKESNSSSEAAFLPDPFLAFGQKGRIRAVLESRGKKPGKNDL